MKMLSKPVIATSLIAGLFAFTGPAIACDMHGAGYGSGAFGMKWQSYNPQASTMDPALAAAKAEESYETPGYSPLPKTAPKKPNFSSAATRASQRALMKRAKAEADAVELSSEKETPQLRKVALDSDG